MCDLRIRIWVYILLAQVFLLSGFADAQTARKPIEKRFLFIIETSSETRKAAETIQQSLNALLETGMGEMVESNDTIGIWTFNNELHVGEFPIQRWNTNSLPEMQTRVENFLKSRRYEKSPKFEAVLPKMMSVIQSSPIITVALFTSGNRAITNAPFDGEINAYFKQNYRQFQKEKMPFVTVFLAHQGKILRRSVSSPFEIKIPKLPPEVIAAMTNAPVKPVKKPVVAPARIAANKTASAPAPKATQALVIGRGGAQLVTATNEGVSLEEEVEKALIAKSAAPPEKPITPEPEPVAPLESKPEPAPEVPVTPAPAVVETLENKSQPDPVAEAVTQKPDEAQVQPAVSQPPIEKTETILEKPAPTEPLKEEPKITTPTQPVVQTEITPKVAEKPPVQVAVSAATPPSNEGNTRWIIFVGGTLFALALMFAFWLGRSTARPAPPSFITQSMDRSEKK